MNNTLKEKRVGVINWDCALPEDTFFGFHASKSLSPQKFRTRTPYYADIVEENKITFHYKTQEEYDKELAYAIDAGIDYFAYAWYTEEIVKSSVKTNGVDLEEKLHELTYARKMHLKSDLNTEIKMCAVLICPHIYTDNDFEILADAMKKPCYEKIDNRPIVYLYGGYRIDYIDKLNEVCSKNSLPSPFICFIDNGALSDDNNYTKADAVSGYACVAKNINTYAQLCEEMIRNNEKRKKYEVDIIPLFTTGWSPLPRIENPVPWIEYADCDYAKDATAEELIYGGDLLCDWIKENPGFTKTGHMLAYAWNEFEEGGYLCPTYNADGSINTERIKAFEQISRKFKDIF